LFLLLQLLFVVLFLAPIILHSLEYQTSTPVREITATPISNPPAQVSHTVDNNGHTLWVVDIHDSIKVTESITWVRHVYVLGVAADWLESANTYRDVTDMYYALLLLNLLAFVLFVGTRRPHVAPDFLNKP
jgi:hypothetical protein